MHWSQQAHDNRAILDLLPNHKGRIWPSQKIGHKTHNDVERDIRNEINQEVTTDRIGELVLQQLKDIDQVAYVRFASVYRKFDNIDSFMEELKALKKLDAKKPKRKPVVEE